MTQTHTGAHTEADGRSAIPVTPDGPDGADEPDAAGGPDRTGGSDGPLGTGTYGKGRVGVVHVSRRGRHRKPRSRRVLLAAVGLTVAVGLLGLVRITPEARLSAPGTAEAESRPSPAATAVQSAHTDASVRAAPPGRAPAASPQASSGAVPAPDATSPTGTSAVGTSVPTPVPSPAATARTAPPAATSAPGSTVTRPPTATTSTNPRPAPVPAPGRTSVHPAPSPAPSRSEGLCVPIIGLCLDAPLTGTGRP